MMMQGNDSQPVVSRRKNSPLKNGPDHRIRSDIRSPKVHTRSWKRSLLRFRAGSPRDQLPLAVGSGIIVCLIMTVVMSRQIDVNSAARLHRHRSRHPTDYSVSPRAVDMASFGYPIRPRLLGANEGLRETKILQRNDRYESNIDKHVDPMSKSIWSEMSAKKRRKQSKKYDDQRKSDGVEPPCVHQHEWQTSSRPTCNKIHEGDWGDRDSPQVPKRINHGGWVEIWKLAEFDGSPLALKSKLYDVEWTERNFDRYRRDAVCLERMSSSPFILNIYAFCGVTAIIQYCSLGDLDQAIHKRGNDMTLSKKLEIAVQVMSAIETVHNVDVVGRASISHTDITTDQFLNIGNDNYRLNDLNRARFIGWDKEKDEACGFEVGSNPGNRRSPEEYRYDLETEKIDVYSGGNALYALLTGMEPFEDEDMNQNEVKRAIKNGERPHISRTKYRNSDNAIIKTLIQAIEMCWTHDPSERPGAKEVADLLRGALDEYKSEGHVVE